MSKNPPFLVCSFIRFSLGGCQSATVKSYNPNSKSDKVCIKIETPDTD